jgi:hypothetical protein
MQSSSLYAVLSPGPSLHPSPSTTSLVFDRFACPLVLTPSQEVRSHSSGRRVKVGSGTRTDGRPAAALTHLLTATTHLIHLHSRAELIPHLSHPTMLLTLLPLLALSLSLPLASSAHLSSTVLHQNALREASFSHHHALPKFRRTLPRTGNRVDRSTIPGQATVKCTSEETWSLCNGEDCTDMGKVAREYRFSLWFRRELD